MIDEKNPPAKAVSSLLLEKLALGELTEAESADVRARLTARGELGRLDELLASNQAILEELPPAQAAHQIATRLKLERDRPTERPRVLVWSGGLAAAVAVAAIALVVVLPNNGGEHVAPDETPEVIRTKGLESRLLVHRRAIMGVERLKDGTLAHNGDILQLSYIAAGARYGVIVSVDGDGGVTRHLPEDGAAAAALSADGSVSLDHSYELDDASAFERFFLVASEAPFDVEPVLAAVRAAGASTTHLALPPELAQATFLVKKPVR